MKLNQAINLRVEDYPDQAKWIGRLFIVLNSLFASINQVLDANIDFSTNIRSVTRDFDSSQLALPITFAWPHTQADPKDVRVIMAQAGTEAIAMSTAWSFNATTREVTVKYLTIINASSVSAPVSGTRYKFSIRATV